MWYDLSGIWRVKLNDGWEGEMHLPGTLDENGIGYMDVDKSTCHSDEKSEDLKEIFSASSLIATRFTRKYTYEGAIELTKTVKILPPEEKRVFLEVERARCLRLFVDGKEIFHFEQETISTPHRFEITGLLTGENEIVFMSDNSYGNLPHDEIVYSSAATDETQTNWNGLLGKIGIYLEDSNFISDVRVYPIANRITMEIDIYALESFETVIYTASEVLKQSVEKSILLDKGKNTIVLRDLDVKEDILYWDEYEGNLYEMNVNITGGDVHKVSFGVRCFGDNGRGRLALNGRTIFVRSETNCAVFPETGYSPTTVEEWNVILEKYKAYGVNLVRFHSHCPPKAAFIAADQMGMMMQPELSHWNPRNAFVSEESYNYYEKELEQILLMLANHPSFVMLTFGNELQTDEAGKMCMRKLLHKAQKKDGTRLYAESSNPFYGNKGCLEESDFYTAQGYFKEELRGCFANHESKEARLPGYINNQYPNARTNYDGAMRRVREQVKKPVFGFEVGQYEILPDFDEMDEFNGITKPDNYLLIKDRAEKSGLLDVWNDYVEATGELACIAYREEIEACMRTEDMSGISLLGLQDFPGQGTALVGMLDAHMNVKRFKFASPERFNSYFKSCLPLVLLPKYTYENDEVLIAEVKFANFGKADISGEVQYELSGENFCVNGTLANVICEQGKLTKVGVLEIPLDAIEKATRLDLEVCMEGISNAYPIWVYKRESVICPDVIYETRTLDEKAREILQKGGSVYLAPDATKESLPNSIRTQFTTDFWSVGTFTKQAGGMGQLIDTLHPIFERFPTEFHTNWQWWPMASQRAVILPRMYKTIIAEIDSYAYMRSMAQLFECRCGNGKLMFSAMGLHDIMHYPECRALQNAIFQYMESDNFNPSQVIPIEVVEGLVKQ